MIAQAMTSKDIAAAVGKPERTVRRWIENLAAKSAVVAAKLTASSPTYPARYNLAESCEIIEEGLGKAAADVYRTNAVQSRVTKRQTQAPNAALLRELRATYGDPEAARRFDFLIGYKAPALPAATQPDSRLLLPPPKSTWEERKAEALKDLSDTVGITRNNLARILDVPSARLTREAERDRNYQSFWHRHEVERIIAHLEAKP